MKIIIKAILAVVIIAAIAYYSWLEMNKPLEIELLTVTRQTIEQSIAEAGKLVAMEEKTIYALASGRATFFEKKIGDYVTEGELILEIDQAQLQWQLAQLRAQIVSLEGQEQQLEDVDFQQHIIQQQLAIEEAQLRLRIAKEDREKIKALVESGATAREQLLQAERAIELAQQILAQQEQALLVLQEQQAHKPQGVEKQFQGLRDAVQAQIRQIEHQQSLGRVYAQASGKVIEAYLEQGATVSVGSPLLKLYNPDEYQVHVYLLAEEAAAVTLGMPVQLEQKQVTGDLSFSGKVSGFGDAAFETVSALGLKETRFNIKVNFDKAELPDNLLIAPGVAVEAKFIMQRQEGQLVLPKTSIFKIEGQDTVWKYNKELETIELQAISTGFEVADRIIVTSGLQANERIVRNPRLEGLQPGIYVVEK